MCVTVAFLSDEGTKDECHDGLAVRDFLGHHDGVPDATTPANFRHLIEGEHVDEPCFDAVVERLDEAGPPGHGGTVNNTTIVETTKSTKYATGERDPETRQAKKGTNWHHGTRVNTGEDAPGGHVHTATLAPRTPPTSRRPTTPCAGTTSSATPTPATGGSRSVPRSSATSA